MLTRSVNTQAPPPDHDDKLIEATTRTIMAHVGLGLAPLTTANKNRVLLKIHAQVADQLDALAATNHT